MSTTMPGQPLNPAVLAAHHNEDIVVGNEIVRHSRVSRLVHWGVAISFFVTLFTGLPIWTPLFGWMAYLFGGLQVCRWLHPWAGVVFSVFSVWMFFYWLGDMRMLPGETREWFGPKLWTYMKYEDEPDAGKYNGGQKLFFFAVSLGMVGVLLTGIVMWLPLLFPRWLREVSIVLHDITFICFMVGVVMHIYLGTTAEPGTFRSMTRGTVTKPWARLHHPGWLHDVSEKGEERKA